MKSTLLVSGFMLFIFCIKKEQQEHVDRVRIKNRQEKNNTLSRFYLDSFYYCNNQMTHLQRIELSLFDKQPFNQIRVDSIKKEMTALVHCMDRQETRIDSLLVESR